MKKHDESEIDDMINLAIEHDAERSHQARLARRRKITLWAIPVILTLSAVGYVIVKHQRLVERGYDTATMLIGGASSLDNPFYPEAEDISSSLGAAAALVKSGSYSAAKDSLDILTTRIDTELAYDGEDGSNEQRRLSLLSLKDEAKWCRALLMLKAKRPRKARVILESISASEGQHADEARGLLDEVWENSSTQ